MMKCFIFLATIALASAKIINQNNCEGVIIDGISHEEEILKNNVDKPYQLAIDYSDNKLYFSYTKEDGEEFDIASINLKTNEFNSISGVTGGFACAVDEKTNSVYFGGLDGIYKLDPETRTAANLGVTNKNIWQIFYKDGLYFTTYPDEQAYLYKNGVVTNVTEIDDTRVVMIGVDKNNNILFSNSSGLFYYTREDGITSHLGDDAMNSITTDSNGKIFFSTPTGIFSFNDETKEVKKHATFINILGMAVESDNSFIYASANSIIRLKSTGKECGSELENFK